MSMETPEWLNRDFFQQCIQSEESQTISLSGFTVEPAVEAGNNYGSELYRCKVDYVKGDLEASISFIVKAPLSSIKEHLGEVYEKEPKFYNEFIKKTYDYSKHDVVPKTYLSPNPQIIVLEDLVTTGYKMVDRHLLLDLAHCQQYIKAKAKLNALSIAVYRDDPKFIESVVYYTPKFVNDVHKVMKNMMEGCLKCIAAYLEDKPAYKEYMDIIVEGSENDTLWNLYIEEENSKKPIKCLIQGDPWCTNMMFKYNSLGKPDGVKLLDFQNVFFLSPVRELIIFLSSSANLEVWKYHMNSLYNLFCDELNGNLTELKCPERLDLAQIKSEIIDLSPLVLMNVCALLPFALADGVVDFSDFLTGNIANIPVRESSIYKIYQGKHFDTVFPHVLDIIAENGVFNYLKEHFKETQRNL